MLTLINQAAEEFSVFEERVRKKIQEKYDPESENAVFWTTYRFQMGFIQRFLFGALVDADWIDMLWSSIFVTLVAKKYHESVTLPSGLRMVYDNH